MLRFAGHSPLPDGSHMEEACIRSFSGETSGDGLPRAAASPSGSEGPGSALGPVPFFHLKPLAEIPHCRRARETVRGNCRAGPAEILARPLTHYAGGLGFVKAESGNVAAK